jgi:hypothetical protein
MAYPHIEQNGGYWLLEDNSDGGSGSGPSGHFGKGISSNNIT